MKPKDALITQGAALKTVKHLSHHVGFFFFFFCMAHGCCQWVLCIGFKYN